MIAYLLNNELSKIITIGSCSSIPTRICDVWGHVCNYSQQTINKKAWL